MTGLAQTLSVFLIDELVSCQYKGLWVERMYIQWEIELIKGTFARIAKLDDFDYL